MVDRDDARLGRLAVEIGLVTESDLEEVLLEAERRASLVASAGGPAPALGEVMVELGLVTQRQLRRLLGAQAVVEAKVTRIGPYQLIAKIGEGGMGAVYQARDLRTEGLVAIKVLPRSKARDPEFLARFEQEARTAFALGHPNIVHAIGLGEADGYHYFAMEYVEGQDVYDILDEKGRVPEEDALSIVIQISQALEHASEEHVVHRDIKPGNILVDRYGVAKLTDFGLALDRDRIGRGRITGSLGGDGGALGTPFYLSPEQARGEPDIDIRSDIYSLGATFYEMVTGRPPFEGSPAEVLSKHLNEQIASPLDIDRTLSPGLCHIIQKMMAKRCDDRYQTPRELLKDLMLVHQGRDPVTERLPSERSSVRASVRPPRRRRRIAGGGRRRGYPRPVAEHLHGAGTKAGQPDADGGRRSRDGPGGEQGRAVVDKHAAPSNLPEGARRPSRGKGGERRRRGSLFGSRANAFRQRLTLVLAALAATSFAGFVAALVMLLAAPAGTEAPLARPPSGAGSLVTTTFESGTSEGWDGGVFAEGAGEGAFSLRVPAAGGGRRGLATRLAPGALPRGGLVAGSRVEMAFLYYYDGPGPITVELACTRPDPADGPRAARFRHVIPRPVRGEWAVARVSGREFARVGRPVRFDGGVGGHARGIPAGHVLTEPTIGAPEASRADLLALDAIWLWTGRAEAEE